MNKKLWKNKFCKFLSRISTIHGLNYVSDRKSSNFTKVFWVSAIILSFLGCLFYFLQVYEKVFVQPDITIKIEYRTFNEFPFPSITICPHNKFPHKVINYRENLEKILRSEDLTDDEKLNMEMAFQSCPLAEDDLMQAKPDFPGIDLVQNLSKEQYKNNETIFHYCWDDCTSDPNSIFSRVFTFNGFCSTFNQLDFYEIFTDEIHDDFKIYNHGNKSNWNLSDGYSKSNTTYPHRIPSKYFSKIVVYLLQDQNEIDNFFSRLYRGYQIYWHLPNEILTHWLPSITVHNINKRSFFLFKVKSFKMTKELQRYNVNHRKCYFTGEKSLKFFKIYTENNCKFECLANYTLDSCGCVRYFMPRNKSMPVCTSKGINCTAEAEYNFEDLNHIDKCYCYPPCDTINYELYFKDESEITTEIIEQILNETIENSNLTIKSKILQNFYEKDGNDDIGKIKISGIHLAVQKDKVEQRVGFSSYQMQQFISDFGGLLSLAMGCSILSVVELIYNAFKIKNEPERDYDKDEDESLEVLESQRKLNGNENERKEK